MFFRPGFNAGVFWCERLSSRRRNATVWNAVWRLNGLVAKALCATHWSGALVSMPLYSRGTVCVKLFCVRRSDPLPSRAWLDVLFVPCLASAAVALPRPVVLLTSQWRSPVAANVPHVPPPEYAPFLRARIHLPASKGRALHVRPRVPVQRFLLLASRKGFALELTLGCKKRHEDVLNSNRGEHCRHLVTQTQI
jgi:hypothetical protein